MSEANACCSGCQDPVVVSIPGSPGADGAPGADGSNGVNAYTTTTTLAVTLPAAAGPVVLATSVADSSWAGIGQVIFISDGTDWAHFRILTIPSSTSFTLYWLDYPNDAVGTSVLAVSSTVSPAGVLATFSPPADLTDSTGGTPSGTLASTVGIQTLEFPHTFIGGTAAVEPVTTWVVPFKFKIISWAFVTEVLLVGAAGSRVANMEIDATDVGAPSTITIPIANSAVGTVTTGSAVAAPNTGNAGQSFSIEIAAGGTQFTAGSGTFIVAIQNMDTVDAISSLNTSITAINATL